MPSRIKIRVDSLPFIGSTFTFNSSTIPVTRLRFQQFRLRPYQVEIAGNQINNPIAIGFQVQLIEQAFNADFNALNNFTIEIGPSNTLEITKIDEEGFFDNYDNNTSPVSLTVLSVTNIIPPPIPKITNVEFLESTNPCISVLSRYTFDISVDRIEIFDLRKNLVDQAQLSSTTYTSSVQLNRGTAYRVKVIKGSQSTSIIINTPPKISISNITKSFTPNGYTVKILVNGSSSGLSYRINTETPQLSPVFQGLLEGTYQFSVLDSYGCVITQEYILVDDFSSTLNLEPYLEISELNSFHFALREDNKPYENYTNTLSFEEEGNKPFLFKHKILRSDIVTIQYRSNYDLQLAKIVDSNNVETIIPVAKKSENTNIFDLRRAFLTSTENGKTGIYFFGGNTYDPITQLPNGSNIYNNNLPPFYEIGSFIQLDTIGWYQITDIFYDEERKTWIAETDYFSALITTDISLKVLINYNQQKYEVYEFTIDFTDLEGCYYIHLESSNDSEKVVYNSELIDVQEKHEKTFEIIYSNSINNEINYSTGIKHILRLPYIRQKTYGQSKNIEVNRSDTKITHLGSQITDRFDFLFLPIPKAIVIKLTRALALDNLFVDGVGYIAEEDYDSELLGNSNVYSFKATLTPNNKQFDSSSNRNVISNVEYSGGLVNIEEGEGFIKLTP